MTIGTQLPETDLWIPLPKPGDDWHPHTVHTHYFEFVIPEAGIGAYVYIKYLPVHRSTQGGVAIFRGRGNLAVLDAEFLDWQTSMSWPAITGKSITTENGLTIDFEKPGEEVRISFRSREGTTRFDLRQTAITPLVARGHVVPGEEQHRETRSRPGGSEQFMRCEGQLTLPDSSHPVSCFAVRDRSWQQVRVEDQGGAVKLPPLGWSPISFGEDWSFNQLGFEAPDSTPAWHGTYELDERKPSHQWGWVYDRGALHELASVRRVVLASDPTTYQATRQEIVATDATGRTFRLVGEAVASAPIPAWPNMALYDSVYRWRDESGRETYATFHEVWFDHFQRTMRLRKKQHLDQSRASGAPL